MFDEETILHSPSGARLALRIRRPEGPGARAAIQINHGLAEHSLRYARFADALAKAGFATYAHDHRGHGTTKAPDAPLGRFAEGDGAARVMDDVLAVHDRIARDLAGVPVVIFGHSMGGLIALNVLIRHSERAAAGAIWNANFTAGASAALARLVLRYERFRLGSDVPSRLLPRLTFQAWGKAVPHHDTLFDWLSRDKAEVEKYIRDPLCGFDATVSLWLDLFDLIVAGADDAKLGGIHRAMPLNLVGGEKDPATFGGKAVLALDGRLKRLGFTDVATTIYPETRHESLNDLNRATVTKDFIAWLDATFPRAG